MQCAQPTLVMSCTAVSATRGCVLIARPSLEVVARALVELRQLALTGSHLPLKFAQSISVVSDRSR